MQGGYLKTCLLMCLAEKLHFANAGESNGQKCIGSRCRKIGQCPSLGPKTMCGRQIARLVVLLQVRNFLLLLRR